MKEKFQKAIDFVKKHDIEFCCAAMIGGGAVIGFMFGKAAGAFTYEEVRTILDTGAYMGYGIIKQNGIEHFESLMKVAK